LSDSFPSFINTEHRKESGSKKGFSRLSIIPLSEESFFSYNVPNSSFPIKHSGKSSPNFQKTNSQTSPNKPTEMITETQKTSGKKNGFTVVKSLAKPKVKNTSFSN